MRRKCKRRSFGSLRCATVAQDDSLEGMTAWRVDAISVRLFAESKWPLAKIAGADEVDQRAGDGD